MIDYVAKMTKNEGCPCSICNDKPCKEACTYYAKYLQCETDAAVARLINETARDFSTLSMRELLNKKQKMPLDIAETYRKTGYKKARRLYLETREKQL